MKRADLGRVEPAWTMTVDAEARLERSPRRCAVWPTAASAPAGPARRTAPARPPGPGRRRLPRRGRRAGAAARPGLDGAGGAVTRRPGPPRAGPARRGAAPDLDDRRRRRGAQPAVLLPGPSCWSACGRRAARRPVRRPGAAGSRERDRLRGGPPRRHRLGPHLVRRRGGITAAACQRTRGDRSRVERLPVYLADSDHALTPEAALERLRTVEAVGFEGLLAEHRAAWAARWADAEVIIQGDPDAERAVRFALFHLLASAAAGGAAAVGARGLTGPVYAGHVLWDADVFVLPVLAAVYPPAARAMLEYRIRRLPAARRLAATRGRAGARFAWESAADGNEVTPSGPPTGRVAGSGSAPGSWRTTSSPPSLGPPAAMQTGQATTASSTARAGPCCSTRPAVVEGVPGPQPGGGRCPPGAPQRLAVRPDPGGRRRRAGRPDRARLAPAARP
jgi:hypothetical protein